MHARVLHLLEGSLTVSLAIEPLGAAVADGMAACRFMQKTLGIVGQSRLALEAMRP